MGKHTRGPHPFAKNSVHVWDIAETEYCSGGNISILPLIFTRNVRIVGDVSCAHPLLEIVRCELSKVATLAVLNQVDWIEVGGVQQFESWVVLSCCWNMRGNSMSQTHPFPASNKPCTCAMDITPLILRIYIYIYTIQIQQNLGHVNLCQVLLACLRSYIRTYVQAYVIPCLHTSTTILTCNYRWSFNSQQQSTTIWHGLNPRELARPLFCFELGNRPVLLNGEPWSFEIALMQLLPA